MSCLPLQGTGGNGSWCSGVSWLCTRPLIGRTTRTPQRSPPWASPSECQALSSCSSSWVRCWAGAHSLQGKQISVHNMAQKDKSEVCRFECWIKQTKNSFAFSILPRYSKVWSKESCDGSINSGPVLFLSLPTHDPHPNKHPHHHTTPLKTREPQSNRKTFSHVAVRSRPWGGSVLCLLQGSQ